MKVYEIIANTVILQQEIFNCSVKQVWEEHIHPRIREIHSLEDVLPYIKNAQNQNTPDKHYLRPNLQGFFVEHQGYVITLIDTDKGKVLQVYQNGGIVYRHPYYNPLSKNMSIILRRHLNIRRIPSFTSWKRIESAKKFDSIINKKLQEI